MKTCKCKVIIFGDDNKCSNCGKEVTIIVVDEQRMIDKCKEIMNSK